MKSRLILAVLSAIFTAEVLAGAFPSARSMVPNGFPASPHQVQVLGSGIEDGRLGSTPEGPVNTYQVKHRRQLP